MTTHEPVHFVQIMSCVLNVGNLYFAFKEKYFYDQKCFRCSLL